MAAIQAAKPREIDQQSNRTGDIGTGARASLLPGEHHHHRARGLPFNRRWTRIGKIDNRIRTTVKIKRTLRSPPRRPIHSLDVAAGTLSARVKTTSASPTRRHPIPLINKKNDATYLGSIAAQKAMAGMLGQAGIDIGTSPKRVASAAYPSSIRRRQRLMVSAGNRVLYVLKCL